MLILSSRGRKDSPSHQLMLVLLQLQRSVSQVKFHHIRAPLPKSWSHHPSTHPLSVWIWIDDHLCKFGMGRRERRPGYYVINRDESIGFSQFVCFTPVISQSYSSVSQAHDLHSNHDSRSSSWGGTVGWVGGALVTTYLQMGRLLPSPAWPDLTWPELPYRVPIPVSYTNLQDFWLCFSWLIYTGT